MDHHSLLVQIRLYTCASSIFDFKKLLWGALWLAVYGLFRFLETREIVLSQRLGYYNEWRALEAFEDKVGEWTKEQPVIWNAGIGPGASFVPTLNRLLFERTKDLYGPYDQITCVRLPTQVASSRAAAEHRLAFEVLTEILLMHDGDSKQLRLQELKQLAAEESYFGYGKISDYLMLQALGQEYTDMIASIWLDPIYDRQPSRSTILERIGEALEGKRYLVVIENLHVPVSLYVLIFVMGQRWPSTVQNRRWLISATSDDVRERSRKAEGSRLLYGPLLDRQTAPPFGDLMRRDWGVLIKEALHDAAKSIYMQLKDKGHPVEFWLHVAQHCLYYAILYHPLQMQGLGGSGHQASNTSSVTSDELVRCWMAENLIFSTTIATKIPSAARQKQSNYYRSAYESGKVIIQALQEYSLLPIVNSGETTSSFSSKDVVTGVSKLAESVPRLRHVDELTSTRLETKWVSFLNDDGRHVSWNWYERKSREGINMTSLILRGCSNMSAFPIDKLLTPHLRVLDLSHTPIDSLPPSFCNLLNLYLLSLRGCSQLETLSPPPSTSDKETSSPLAHLENLEVLDMNGVPLLELTQQDVSKKTNLHYLDVSGSKFATLPSEFFCEMSSLEELIFGNCTELRELPPSMALLSNLLVLHVEGTKIKSFPEHMFTKMQILNTLKLINNVALRSLPISLSEAKGLKELHISNCAGLILESLWKLVLCLEDLHIQTWKSLENIKILGHPTLRTFSLSGPWIRCLSLRGCSKLKILNFSDDLTALEDVDLSGTDLQEVPHSLPNLPQFRTLLLLGVPCSMRFPWHQLVRFPKIFCLDHCADDDDNHVFKMFRQKKLCADGNHHEGDRTTNTAQITINDPRMFHSFNADAARKLVKEGQFLQSFNVQVKPSSVTGKRPQNRFELCTRIQRRSTYHDVHYSTAASIVSPLMLQPMQRHVELSAVNQYPNGLRHILSVASSIFITDDNFVRRLTDLNYNLSELEECQLQRCHQMTVVFLIHSRGSRGTLSNLQILQIFDLNNLLCLVEPSDLSRSALMTLELLKHILIEHCPRLEKMFPCSLSLPALETLVILFCSNLKTIFYKQTGYEVAPSPFPSIKSIYLQELPKLQHIHDDVMFRFETPKWQKLFLRGCQSFQHLPLLKKEYPKSKVEVSGERGWWNRLQSKVPEPSEYYMHVAPPEFVSPKKHIIQSYLR